MWFRHSKKKHRNKDIKRNQLSDNPTTTHKDIELKGNLEEANQYIDNLLGENDDFASHSFRVFGKYQAKMFYFSNLVSQSNLNTEILKPFMYIPPHLKGEDIDRSNLKEILMYESLYHSEGKLVNNLFDVIQGLLQGETAILIEGITEGFLIGTRNVEKRAISQPPTEQVIRGPRDGFVETIGTNISLLRFRLQTSDFRVHSQKIGRETKVKVAVCYLKGIANPELVKEVQSRLDAIDIDGILDSGYLEQLIEDHHFSPFPQIANTERPDKGIAQMLEGRVMILVDGSPFALIVPAVFSQFYQTIEDYSERFMMGTLVRIIRLIALTFALIFPSLYVSIISFNPELIPTDFAVAVAGGRAGVPFPAVIEVLIMEISMEILREATIRLPQQVGGALSIVGVLVIGQAAVSAGFASPITVVVIALTTISSFATPAYNAAIALRMLRFPLVILGGIFGLYGVMIGLIFIVNHMLSLKSFGIPYMSPIVPGNFQGMKDTLIRAPIWWMPKRPDLLHPGNKTRMDKSTMQEIKQPPSNTLDPLNVGNERWDNENGVSKASDDGSSGNRNI
jgi:spore germination protein KA